MHALKRTLDQFRAATAHLRGQRFFARSNAETKTGEVYIYDVIGGGFFGGVSAQSVVEELKALKGASELSIYINSPGGDVFEGVAIYNALKRFDGKKTVYIDGLAASIASIIALAGDEVVTAANAMWMVHNPWTFCVGDAAVMRKTADDMDKMAGVMLETYCKRTGQSAEQMKAWMDAETWMTATEAKERGFTNAVLADSDGDDDGDKKDDKAAALSVSPIVARYKNTPKEIREQVDGRALLADVSERLKKRQASLPSNKPGQPGAK